MNKELYFLRSSEQHILKDMVKLAYPSDATDLNIYTDFYGLTKKDLGLYALVDNEIAGAIWTRELLTSTTPVMSVALVPKFEDEDIASFMMDQFLQEAGAVYEHLSIDISHKQESIEFYENFGFEKQDDFILIKKLEKKEVFRPSDGYDPTRWMD